MYICISLWPWSFQNEQKIFIFTYIWVESSNLFRNTWVWFFLFVYREEEDDANEIEFTTKLGKLLIIASCRGDVDP